MMEEIFNWVMLGWLLNIFMFIVVVVILIIKINTKDDLVVLRINLDIYTQRSNQVPKYQMWASWLLPFYGALKSSIFAGYFIKNYSRDTIIVLIELDEILEKYRIWKRGGFAN